MTDVTAPEPPRACFSVGVTGHRQSHRGYAGAADAIGVQLASIFDLIDQARVNAATPFGPETIGLTRLHTLLVDGTDQLAATHARERGWNIVSPLPFGRDLNLAINSAPATLDDARALLSGVRPADPATAARAAAIEEMAHHAHLFELADQDDRIARLFCAMLAAPGDDAAAKAFTDEAAMRAVLAGRVVIEQSDVLVAVWDGRTTTNRGGAGDTVVQALDHATPVLWIDPARPADWRFIHAPESLFRLDEPETLADREETLAQIVGNSLGALDTEGAVPPRQFLAERWHDSSTRWAHAYRRAETLFGGGGRPLRSIVQRYEPPHAIAAGSLSSLSTVIGQISVADPALAKGIEAGAMANFAWADGISAHLSDAYRGGMIVNFVLSALAIVSGMFYLPLTSLDNKWMFALVELLLLLGIVAITMTGQRRRWHARWFETRRVTEYFRHSPLLLLVGAARAPGLWPQATGAAWPEWFARQALRAVGLPRVRITGDYLHAALKALLVCHVAPQRDYHRAKAERLKHVHHNLDRASEWMFALALLSVALYLALRGLTALGWIDPEVIHGSSKTFTVLGVLFPTLGAAIAGMRYFGDFERFAAISRVTAEKLDAVHQRATLLLGAPPEALDYGGVVALVHAADEVVIAEIENWQSVFGGKNITVPV